MPKYTRGDFYELEAYLEGRFNQIQEQLMTLQSSANRLGDVVQKLVVDGQTVKNMLAALQAEIDRLVAQGTANQAELNAMKADFAAAVPKIDTHISELEALDSAVQDPTNPIDPEAPV
jgi:peptidoglycan hydrolase CwlO-like protein